MSDIAERGHFIRLADLDDSALEQVLDLSRALKERPDPDALKGRMVGQLFFRGSLRTRISLEVAMRELGGSTVNLSAASDFWDLEARMGTVMDGAAPEHVKDAAATLSRYVQALAIRPRPAGRSWENDRRDESIAAWARYAQVPVVNMESVLYHPLQALADLLTLRESLGELEGKRLAITWTRSPTPASPAVLHSVLLMALRGGMDVAVAHPPGYELDPGVISEAQTLASTKGRELQLGLEMNQAAEGAHVVYARSWQSLEVYGNPTLAASRGARAGGWTVDERVMQLGQDAHLMHPMPVRRNLEVSDEVLDGERSLVYRQAENRLHTQKGLLTHLLR